MINQDAGNAYILFELAGTTYGIKSEFVKQMEMVENITPVPNAPSFVEGVVFSRGQVIPAINLRLRFGFQKIPYDLRTRLVVVQAQNRIVGLIVDTAREFIALSVDLIQPAPEAISGLSGKYLSGFASINDRPILIFNVEEVLNLSNLTEQLNTIDKGE